MKAITTTAAKGLSRDGMLAVTRCIDSAGSIEIGAYLPLWVDPVSAADV